MILDEFQSFMVSNLSKISDSQYFESLYMLHFNELYRFAFHYIMSKDAEDIVQDVFVKLYNDKENIDDKENIRAYLYKLTKNSCINYLKHLSIENKHQDNLMNSILSIVDYDFESEQEINGKIVLCLSSLPDKQREIIELRLKGCDYKEIAQKLGISTGTVNTHINRAYKSIKENYMSIYLILNVLDHITH